jgi:N-acetylglucosamine-6-phosphate deacetylase
MALAMWSVKEGKGRMIRIEGIHFQTGERISLSMVEGRIREIESKLGDVSDALPFIGPGLIDLQINGNHGLDFNTLPIDENLVQQVTHSLWNEGVTSYFPTIITNSDEAIEKAVRLLAR